MVVTKHSQHDLPKYHELGIPSKSIVQMHQHSKSPGKFFPVLVGMAVLLMSAALGMYLGHFRMEMKRMATMVQENQLEIAELRSELGLYRQNAYKNIPPMVNEIMQRQVNENKKERVRRDSQGQDTFTVAHLVGEAHHTRRVETQSPSRGGFFFWSQSHSNAFSMMELQEDDDGTLIIINRNGYYFVYSQVNYNGYGEFEIGHRTVCVQAQGSKILMESVSTQQMASAKGGVYNRRRSHDTAYHGGVFYLYAGDKIGVQPQNWSRSHSYTTRPDDSFFGMYFLHD